MAENIIVCPYESEVVEYMTENIIVCPWCFGYGFLYEDQTCLMPCNYCVGSSFVTLNVNDSADDSKRIT